MKDFVKSRGLTPPLRHPARALLAPACVHRAATCVLGLGLCLGFVNAGAQQDAAGGGAGAWWEGEPGVTESVQQIMDRAAQEGLGAQFPAPVPRQLKGRLAHWAVPPGDNPFSPALAQWPPPEQASGGSGSPQPFQPQTVGSSFLGATFFDTIGYVPPDSMGAVGPSQVLVIVNGRIRVFDKSGNKGALDTTTDSFFASVRSASTSDPHVRYDRLSQRWFITMLDVANTNRILIAASSGSLISGASSFTFFQFQHDRVGPTPNSDTGGFADYDTLGVDKFALYIGVNVFANASGTAFFGTTGFVVNKANLLAGTLSVTPFRQMGAAGGSGPGILTPQGVDNNDPNATEGYFIGTDNQFYGLLNIIRISNPGGVPTIGAKFQMTVLPTTAPIAQVQKGSSLTLDGLDDRLFGAAIHRNQITGTSSLWTAHNFQVDTNGVANNTGGRNGSRWYEIGSLTTTPSLVQSGTLFDSASSNPRGLWIPGIAASGQGHMALGCSYAGLNDYPGIAVAGRWRTDPLGTIQAPTLALVSSSTYTLNSSRWGDYSTVAIDPTDDMTMWAFDEFSDGGVWGVQAVQLKAPPPVTPSAASPASVAQGQASVSVAITGTSTSGSEFFDPGPDAGGPGFAKHISASVSGGVVVNSVTFNSPTQVTLSLNTASAASGAQSVTVTNPDGQASTGSAILTISSSTLSCTVSPANATVCAGISQTFTATPVGGTAPYNYGWTGPNGFSASSATIIASAAGTYTVMVTDSTLPTHLTSTCTAALTVNPLPTVSVNSPAICAGGSATLTATTSASSPTYSWSPGGATTASITVSPTSTTTYTVSVTDGTTHCSNTGSGTVTINPLPTVSVNSPAICTGGSATLTATTSASSPTYSWSPGGATTASITVSPTSTTTYTVSVADGTTHCSNTGSGTVTVNPLPVTSPITGSSSACANEAGATYSVTLTIGSSYAWAVPPGAMITSGAVGPNNNSITVTFGTTSGNVTVTETSTAGCVGVTRTETVTVAPCAISCTVSPASATVCAGNSQTFTATPVGGTAPYTYGWTGPNGFNASSATITVSAAGTYTVTVTDSTLPTHLTSTCTAALTVNPLPVTSPITGSSSACANEAGATYSVTLTTGSSYAWTVPPGATITSGTVGPNNNSITVTFGTTSGNVTVTETSAAGCVGTMQTLPVTVTPCGFSLSPTPTSQTVSAGSRTTYTVTVTPSGSFSGIVNFSVSGLPTRTSANFNPSSVNTSGSTTLTVSTNRRTTKGTYNNVKITGASGSLQHIVTVTLVVQ